MLRHRWPVLAVMAMILAFIGAAVSARPDSAKLTLVVMDPLAAPLSCPCVKGYAQRDYDQLGKYLEGQLGRPVAVAYSDSLAKALKDKTSGKADIIIGKRSVVLADAKANQLSVTGVASLTGKDGLTTQTGLIVVPKNDPAKTVADLKGYRIIFGTPECDEKYAAPLDLLKQHRVPAPSKLETCAACSDGATTILELGPNVRAATVISSYAAPLLEGCGTIQKGDLRVVGTTAPVAFIDAFVADAVSPADRTAIQKALLKLVEHPPLLVALETQKGFVATPSNPEKKR